MNYIELIGAYNDKKYIINTNHIQFVTERAESETTIVLVDGWIEVKGSYEEIKKLVNPVQKEEL